MNKYINRIVSIIITIILIYSCGIFNRSVAPKQYVSSFTNNEITLIMEKDSTFPMRVLSINNTDDYSILRAQALPVVINSSMPFVENLIKRMKQTILDSTTRGVGIAAPQVGISQRIIIVQRFDKVGEPIEYYINPKILKYSKKIQSCFEGCLSIPNKRADIKKRSYSIMIEYYKITGERVVEMIEDYTAVIFQHEIDHLDGKLFTDYI